MPAAYTALIDADMGRIAAATAQAAGFRLWLLAHNISRVHGGHGWCAIEALWASMADLPGHHCTRRHFRRILHSGDDVFWHIKGESLSLISISKVAAELCITAGLLGLESVLATNTPGSTKRVEIDLSGSHEQFESELYRAWLVAVPRDTFSRETLCNLFNRGDDTLRRWEKKHLAGSVDVIPNFALVESDQPAYADDLHYDAKFRSLVYQIPNTYQAHGFQIGTNGQRRRIKRAIAGVETVADAKPTRLYFTRSSSLRRAIRRHPSRQPRYLFTGQRAGAGVWFRSADIFTTL